MEFRMSKGFVLIGDNTTHGGQVISASSTMVVNGKKVALVGDKVSCPKMGMALIPLLKDRLNGPLTVKPWLWMVATVSAVAR